MKQLSEITWAKKPYRVNTSEIEPMVAPLHEGSNSWTLAMNNDIEVFITEIRPDGAALRDNHPDADHLFYYLSGYGYHIVDGERIDFGPNDAVFIPRGCDHEMYVTGRETLRMVVTLSPARKAKWK